MSFKSAPEAASLSLVLCALIISQLLKGDGGGGVINIHGNMGQIRVVAWHVLLLLIGLICVLVT